MATDVDIQYFSHLNGLTLGNNWGDLIRLLDKALVTGIDFTQITAASIDAQGDVHITLYSAHNAMLFQVVEMTGFTPQSLNQRYRIKGVPNTTQLILKPKTEIVERAITTKGTGKLASLGYEIIFRDTNDVKRVYRARNPSVQHPFIRVDETISDGVNSYNSAYAKYAMVGLLEHMDHIDDYQNPDVLQLPFEPSDPAKNWKIIGVSGNVIRGWGKWYFATYSALINGYSDINAVSNGNRPFTLIGGGDYFYLLNTTDHQAPASKGLKGCGLYKHNLDNSIAPNWFLMGALSEAIASAYRSIAYASPLGHSDGASKFLVPAYNLVNKLSRTSDAIPIIPDYRSGSSQLTAFTGNHVPALEVPFYDSEKYLRGSVPGCCYAGKKATGNTFTTPILSDASMYLWDSADSGGFYFYMGELE